MQYETQYVPGSIIEPFTETGRWAVEQAVGGQPAWDAGVNFAKLLASSPYLPEVKKLYSGADLNLSTDLSTLTAKRTPTRRYRRSTTWSAHPCRPGSSTSPSLTSTRSPTRWFPCSRRASNSGTVSAAGDSQLLRQAYVEAQGHCNFTPAEYVAGVEAILDRVRAGQQGSTNPWGSVASAKSLQATAVGLNEGGAAFIPYTPGALTGSAGTFDPTTQGVP